MFPDLWLQATALYQPNHPTPEFTASSNTVGVQEFAIVAITIDIHAHIFLHNTLIHQNQWSRPIITSAITLDEMKAFWAFFCRHQR